MSTDIARVAGARLDLRLVGVDDAAYIQNLRTDPRYNAHLSAVSGTVQDQASWIASYKEREATGQELYFIMERKDGRQCGTVRLYEITAESFSWGSWILDENKPAKAALESAMLVYRIAFNRLCLMRAVFDVRRDNVRTLAFHDRFGATRVREDDLNVYYVFDRETFERLAPALERLCGELPSMRAEHRPPAGDGRHR